MSEHTAQLAATKEPTAEWLAGWSAACTELDAYVADRMDRADEHGDQSSSDAYGWAMCFAQLLRADHRNAERLREMRGDAKPPVPPHPAPRRRTVNPEDPNFPGPVVA